MTQVSFALIGCGTEGRNLTQVAKRLRTFRCVAVYDENPGQAEAWAAEVGAEAAASWEPLLDREEVAAFFIATPNDTHREVTERVLAAGKAAYVVPPLALTTAECDGLLHAAGAGKGPLFVGHRRRFHPLLAQLRRTIALGSLGRPLAAHLIRRESLLWEEGSWESQAARTGGVLRHWGLEEIDVLQAVFGEVATVYAQAGPQPIRSGIDFPDVISLQMGFASGLTAQLQICLTDFLPHTSAAVMGTAGSLSLDLSGGVLHYRRADGIEVKFEPNEVERAAFEREATETALKSFAAWLTEGTEPLLTAAEARAALAVAEAALASLERGTVVRVGEEQVA
jgi:UDP-N-acetylglucosamine 3-dehydrogenase